MSFILRNLILLVVFITGAAVLAIEVTATRILAPWYGNTIFTFSSVISVILAALSMGYYFGGKLSDRYPSARVFFGIIALSGIAVYFCQLLAVTALPRFGYSLSIMTGPLVFSLLMFFLPPLLLGTLSPWAIKLQSISNPDEGVGTTAGKVFFWSTMGSIVGSLTTGFFLIPHLGLNAIMLGTATLLTVMGLVGFVMQKGRMIAVAAALILAIALGAGAAATAKQSPNVLYSEDGVYERINVSDLMYHDRPVRALQQDRAVSGMLYMDNGEVLDYVRYLPIVNLLKPDVKRALAIGGGTYIMPRVMVDDFPKATVDVAEIEPSLYEVSQQFFGVQPTPRLRNHITDGRRFLHDSPEPYDLIFTDVYYAMSIPSHFATREFYDLAHDKLTSGGVYMANLVGDFTPSAPNILYSQMRLIREVFPNSMFFATISPDSNETQSVVAFSVKGDNSLDLKSTIITESPNEMVRELPSHVIDESKIDWEKYALMTDNYAPAEYFALFTLSREMGR